MDFLQLFLGDSKVFEWGYASFLVLLGFVLLKLVQYENRTEKHTRFDFSYWWKDNRIEFFSGMIIFYILFRFFSYFAPNLEDLPFIKIPKSLIEEKFLVVFMLGLFLQLSLKYLRKILKIRHSKYQSGTKRPEHI